MFFACRTPISKHVGDAKRLQPEARRGPWLLDHHRRQRHASQHGRGCFVRTGAVGDTQLACFSTGGQVVAIYCRNAELCSIGRPEARATLLRQQQTSDRLNAVRYFRFRSAVGRNLPSVAANSCSNPSKLTKRRQPVGRTTAYVIEAPEVLDSNEADRLDDHDRLPRRPDTDAGGDGDNLEVERADAALTPRARRCSR